MSIKRNNKLDEGGFSRDVRDYAYRDDLDTQTERISVIQNLIDTGEIGGGTFFGTGKKQTYVATEGQLLFNLTNELTYDNTSSVLIVTVDGLVDYNVDYTSTTSFTLSEGAPDGSVVSFLCVEFTETGEISVTASNVEISDVGNYFIGETTEVALQEIGVLLDGLDEALGGLL